jgi:hypothetical protein
MKNSRLGDSPSSGSSISFDRKGVPCIKRGRELIRPSFFQGQQRTVQIIWICLSYLQSRRWHTFSQMFLFNKTVSIQPGELQLPMWHLQPNVSLQQDGVPSASRIITTDFTPSAKYFSSTRWCPFSLENYNYRFRTFSRMFLFNNMVSLQPGELQLQSLWIKFLQGNWERTSLLAPPSGV